ncbi:MAG: hypothetical protein LBD22_05760, partial [Spirochaetaceae bacterium]|nr:hypothetical protein [Spirochaetaceae bacterium]
ARLAYSRDTGLKRGLRRGLKQGLRQGKEEGLQEGLERGIQQGHADILKLINEGLSAEQIRERLSGSSSEQ